jgi:hypothetical protein
LTLVVSLSPWEYEYAFQVGIRRFTANWQKNDAPHYDRSRMELDREAQVAAAICELAVAKHINRYWHASIWHESEHAKHRNQPDVGDNVEVRRVRTDVGPAVRERDRGRVVWGAKTTGEFREVELLGWILGTDGWLLGEDRPGGYKVVPAHMLRS